MTSSLFSDSLEKTIYLIKDECHIATNNLDEMQNYFSKIINFSATPKLSRKQTPDVEITNAEAQNAKIIKTVKIGSKEDTLSNALDKFEEIKAQYTNLLGVNPSHHQYLWVKSGNKSASNGRGIFTLPQRSMTISIMLSRFLKP